MSPRLRSIVECAHCGTLHERTRHQMRARRYYCSRACAAAGATQDPAARFWAKVDRTGGPEACWPWLGGRKKNHYGNFCVERRGRAFARFVTAHRYAYQLVYGPVPDGMVICHRCDHPWCVNPAHLWAGTSSDNARDAIRKGRAYRTPRRLTLAQAATIRTRYHAGGITQAALALEYGVSDTTIADIVAGRRYKAAA